MSKKNSIGKIILGAVTLTAGVVALCYYFNQDRFKAKDIFDDEDFDSFDVDFDDEEPRNYTTLENETSSDSEATSDTSEKEENELVKEAGEIASNATETLKEANHVIENFFDDEK